MSVYRFTRLRSHDRGDERCSAAATAQTFFLNPRRPRSSSRPMIRNVMTPSQESNGGDRSARAPLLYGPATHTDTQQEPRAFGEYDVCTVYLYDKPTYNIIHRDVAYRPDILPESTFYACHFPT